MMEWVLKNEKAPSIFALSRQDLPHIHQESAKYDDVKKGAWIIQKEQKPLDLIIFATGSEVSLALQVIQSLNLLSIRLVSVPCWKYFFFEQSSLIRTKFWQNIV